MGHLGDCLGYFGVCLGYFEVDSGYFGLGLNYFCVCLDYFGVGLGIVVKYVLLKSTAKSTLRTFRQKLTYFLSMIYSQSSLGALGPGTQPRRKCRTQPIIYH